MANIVNEVVIDGVPEGVNGVQEGVNGKVNENVEVENKEDIKKWMKGKVENLSKLDKLERLHDFEQLLEEKKNLIAVVRSIMDYYKERELLDRTSRKHDQGKIVEKKWEVFQSKLEKVQDLL